jgi:DNA-binding MarR family transcriptional regulator
VLLRYADGDEPASATVTSWRYAALGTRLRHLLELLDGGVEAVYVDLGVEAVRPRFVPILRVLAEQGPQPIRVLADATGVTHSAASQTVAQMVRAGLVGRDPGADARQRIVALSAEATALLPTVEAEQAATAAAAEALDAELPYPLDRLVDAALDALAARPMHERIRDQLAGRGARSGA